MQGNVQLSVSAHIGWPNGYEAALTVADCRDAGVVDDIDIRCQRFDDSRDLFGAILWSECKIHLKGVFCLGGDYRKSGQSLLSFGLAVKPQRPASGNQAAHAPKEADHVDPRRGQPFKAPHTHSPVLSDNFTVRATAGGVTPHAISGSVRPEGC